MREDHYEDLLSLQLRMNKQTWSALQRHGVDEQTPLRLDFSYNAPSRSSAEELRSFLAQETDYDVRVESDGWLLSKRWRLEGTTQSTTLSQQTLDEWVTWMVIAGKENGGCDFDGWGTPV
ncbi:MAG TPA: ribonuclease E inhibitor RraB [Blastocatellia bacterium]|nr:ribonuclease E inhibitor RraB [Blastocatellia bacterium]